ncbi:IS66-like element accessory protein TnpA [Buttiauxella ferragutiae]|uniref:IS66-like element accessory protein TnpA n=1 Tax=Buttiauxella ferragutiae TaxID=82989 RepID=UPI003524D0F2
MMNTGTGDIEYRQQLYEVLRLRFDEKLSIRAISQQVSMGHSTVHIMVQRFAKSGVPWPLPKKLSAEHLDVILFPGRRKATKKLPETRLPSDDSWRTRPRTRYSRKFKEELVRQSLQPGTSVAYLARENGINANLLFKWKTDLQEEALATDSVSEGEPLPVELTSVPEPVIPATNPFWRNMVNKPTGDGQPSCELHLKAGVVKLFDPVTPELLRALIREMKSGVR